MLSFDEFLYLGVEHSSQCCVLRTALVFLQYASAALTHCFERGFLLFFGEEESRRKRSGEERAEAADVLRTFGADADNGDLALAEFFDAFDITSGIEGELVPIANV